MVWDDHEARCGAGLGPCHPNREVLQFLSQMIQNLNIHLWRRCMDPGVGIVVGYQWRADVQWIQSLIGEVLLWFDRQVFVFHMRIFFRGGGVVKILG